MSTSYILASLAYTAGLAAAVLGVWGLARLLARIARDLYPVGARYADFAPVPDVIPADWCAVVPLHCDGRCGGRRTTHEVAGDGTATCADCGHTTPELRHG